MGDDGDGYGKHDDDGSAGDSRDGLHEGVEAGGRLVGEEIESPLQEDGGRHGASERGLHRDAENPKTIEELKALEAEFVPYSEPLPPPRIFYAYEKDVQDTITEAYRASTSDESERQDRIVDAVIRQTRAKTAANFAINALTIGGALAAMCATNDPAALLALLVPGVTVVANVVVNSRGKDR